MPLFTYEDAVQHALDYMGADVGEAILRDAKRAVINATADLEACHPWSYLYAPGRIDLVAPYAEGTVRYDDEGGVGTDELRHDHLWTVSDGTPLPAWVAGAELLVADVVYRIGGRLSDTEFTTSPWSPPGDLADRTFTIFQDVYPLPPDAQATGQLFREKPVGEMTYVHPSEILEAVRRQPMTGNPRWYTIEGMSQYGPGRLAFRVYPAPLEARTVDFIYKRQCSDLGVYRHDAGTASIAPSVVTGQGTAFTPAMAGAVLRLSGDRTKSPTSAIGNNPPVFEAIVTEVVGPTLLKVWAPDGTTTPAYPTYAATKYTLSTLIDIEQTAMLAALQRGIEFQVSVSRVIKDKPAARALYMEALRFAKAADSRAMQGRVMGEHWTPIRRAGGSIQYVRGGVT